MREQVEDAPRGRRGQVADDLGLVREGGAVIRVPGPARTSELRRRYLGLLLDGLATNRLHAVNGTGRCPAVKSAVY